MEAGLRNAPCTTIVFGHGPASATSGDRAGLATLARGRAWPTPPAPMPVSCHRASSTNGAAVQRGAAGYAQICDLIRARVARGELRPGERLRPVRELAVELGVNVNTVARAYAELAREGVIVTHAGGGSHVADPNRAGLFQEARETRLRELVGGAVLQALGLGYRPEQIEAAVIGQLGRWGLAEAPRPAPPRPPEQALLFAGSHDLTLDLLAARLQRREPPVWLQTDI